MKSLLNREDALELLRKYNKDTFHIYHGLIVEGTMRWFAKELGYGEDEDYWGITGLLHDIDFELYPEEHCQKAPELLREGGCGEDMIYSICSHGYKIRTCNTLEAFNPRRIRRGLNAYSKIGLKTSIALGFPILSPKVELIV